MTSNERDRAFYDGLVGADMQTLSREYVERWAHGVASRALYGTTSINMIRDAINVFRATADKRKELHAAVSAMVVCEVSHQVQGFSHQVQGLFEVSLKTAASRIGLASYVQTKDADSDAKTAAEGARAYFIDQITDKLMGHTK